MQRRRETSFVFVFLFVCLGLFCFFCTCWSLNWSHYLNWHPQEQCWAKTLTLKHSNILFSSQPRFCLEFRKIMDEWVFWGLEWMSNLRAVMHLAKKCSVSTSGAISIISVWTDQPVTTLQLFALFWQIRKTMCCHFNNTQSFKIIIQKFKKTKKKWSCSVAKKLALTKSAL